MPCKHPIEVSQQLSKPSPMCKSILCIQGLIIHHVPQISWSTPKHGVNTFRVTPKANIRMGFSWYPCGPNDVVLSSMMNLLVLWSICNVKPNVYCEVVWRKLFLVSLFWSFLTKATPKLVDLRRIILVKKRQSFEWVGKLVCFWSAYSWILTLMKQHF
jgi:hypothetical protein